MGVPAGPPCCICDVSVESLAGSQQCWRRRASCPDISNLFRTSLPPPFVFIFRQEQEGRVFFLKEMKIYLQKFSYTTSGEGEEDAWPLETVLNQSKRSSPPPPPLHLHTLQVTPETPQLNSSGGHGGGTGP